MTYIIARWSARTICTGSSITSRERSGSWTFKVSTEYDWVLVGIAVGGGGGVEVDAAGLASVEALLVCAGVAAAGAAGMVCSVSNSRIRVMSVALLPFLHTS